MREIEELYLLYKDDIYRYLIYLTHDPDLSEDLLSETFVSAIRSIKSFQGRSTVKTWLFAIARNQWLQTLRKKQKTLEYNDLLEVHLSESMEDRLIDREVLERIKSLLDTKNQQTQTIVNMRIEGYSFAEIAEELGINESSARVVDFRTKKWIKKILEEEDLS